MRIKAAVVREKGIFAIEFVDIGEPSPDEVLVRVVAAGICHTDLVVSNQNLPLPLPAILGHEGAGEVLEVGANVRNVAVGDHVLLTFASCGDCGYCQQGRPAYCTEFMRYNFSTRRPDGSCVHHQDGKPLTGSFFYQSSFASHAIAHKSNVVRVSKDVPLDIIAPLGCGIQTGAGAILNALRPMPGSSLAVFGVGAVGMAALMAGRLSGCGQLIAIDMHEQRLELARSLGATHTVNAGAGDVVDAIRMISAAGLDFSIEATGVPAVVAQAIRCLGSTGTAMLLGVVAPGTELVIDAAALSGGRTVRTSIEGDSVPRLLLPRLVDLYRRGALPIDRLVKTYELADINQAAHDAQRGTIIKAVIVMPS